ncbi:MAG TPA: EAL domain-containing protein [Thermoanaerobaculia bacterium]|jgi:EAL domain-containing protein (putative c-di-GMP-specific phosphodiesterase class I)|nr:EAL domain-containing protein [Thermoanaerobaculia bacterium]
MANAHAALENAIDRENVVVVYQPIHDVASRRMIAAEALMRQRRESGEIREAAILTETAEKAPRDEMIDLDEILLERAFTGWRSDLRLHVNLSPREFQRDDVVTRVRRAIETAGVNPRQITLEITETSHIKHLDDAARVLREMKALGVELWLDDFGTGHSTIEQLYRFPVDGLKIPATFVTNVDRNRRSRAITKSLIALAHDLALHVIAEGVEREGQLAALSDLDCDAVQGFLFSRPVTLEELLSGSSDPAGAPGHPERSA